MPAERETETYSEIGDVPKNWNVKSLNSSLKLLKDGTHLPPKRTGNGIRFIAGASDIKYFKIDFSNCTFISEKDYAKIHKYYQLKENDVLLTIVGTVGNTAIIRKSDLPFSLQRSIAILRPNDELNPVFLFYWLNTPRFKKMLFSRINQTAQPGIYLGELGKLSVLIPPLSEQENIANFLINFDLKIELNQKLNRILENVGQVIFKRWFIDFEFPNKNGKLYASSGGKMVDSELGKIPKDWEVVDISKVTKIIDCLHSKKPQQLNEGKILLQVFNIKKNGKMNLTDFYYVSDVDYAFWTRKIELKTGDLIISKTGRVGAIAQIPDGLKFGIGRNLVAIRPTKISPTYALEFLLSKYGKREIQRFTMSGTILRSLHVKYIKKIQFLVPPANIIKQYEKIARPLRAKIENNIKENITLSQLREKLLPKLMSGKIRVPVSDEVEG